MEILVVSNDNFHTSSRFNNNKNSLKNLYKTTMCEKKKSGKKYIFDKKKVKSDFLDFLESAAPKKK